MPTVPKVNLQISGGAGYSPIPASKVELPKTQSLLGSNVTARNAGAAPRPNTRFNRNFREQPDHAEYEQDRQTAGLAGGLLTLMAETTQAIQDDVDEAVVKEADNKLGDMIRGSLSHPETGYLAKKGKSALGARKATQAQIGQARKEIEESLQNDRQKQVYREASQARIDSALNRVDEHSLTQLQVYKAAESKARIQAAKQDAIANWGSRDEKDANGKPIGAFNLHKQAMIGEIGEQLKQIGFVPGTKEYSDAFQVAVLGETTDLHTQVIGNMVSAELSMEASEYLKANGGEIDPASWDDLNNLIKTGTTKDLALQIFYRLKGTNKEKREQVKAAFLKGDIIADVHNGVKDYIDKDEAQTKSDKAHHAENVKLNVGRYLVEHPEATYLDLPAQMIEDLKATGQVPWATAFVKSGYQLDSQMWAEFLTLSPEEKANMTPIEFRARYLGKLDDAHLTRGEKLVGDDPTFKPNVTRQEHITSRAKGPVIPVNKRPTKTQAENLIRYDAAVDRHQEAWMKANKKEPDHDQMDKIIDGVLLDMVKVDQYGFDPTRPYELLSDEKKEDTYVMVNLYDPDSPMSHSGGAVRVNLASIPPRKLIEYTEIIRKADGQIATWQRIAEMWAREQGLK